MYAFSKAKRRSRGPAFCGKLNHRRHRLVSATSERWPMSWAFVFGSGDGVFQVHPTWSSLPTHSLCSCVTARRMGMAVCRPRSIIRGATLRDSVDCADRTYQPTKTFSAIVGGAPMQYSTAPLPIAYHWRMLFAP